MSTTGFDNPEDNEAGKKPERLIVECNHQVASGDSDAIATLPNGTFVAGVLAGLTVLFAGTPDLHDVIIQNYQPDVCRPFNETVSRLSNLEKGQETIIEVGGKNYKVTLEP